MNFNKELALALIDSNIEFPVDLDDAMQWWDCRTKDGSPTTRRQLIAKLKQNFDQGLDWTFAQICAKVQTGRPTDKIYLTVDTFKEMGMMLPNGKGKEIRRYFLECERELKNVKAQNHAISDKPTPHEIFDFVTMVLSITELDKQLIAASAANHVAKYYPALRPAAEELKKELVIETSEKLLTPTEIGLILYQRTGVKKDALDVVTDLPTRVQIREWLLNPPEPPFTLAIAESGQKHILFLAQEAHSRDIFPVQFELDSLHLDRAKFTVLLQNYEALMALDFSKTEIDSGDYRSDRLLKSLAEWEFLEAKISPIRGSRLLQLISYTAIASNNIYS